jgi:hypothetical protein
VVLDPLVIVAVMLAEVEAVWLTALLVPSVADSVSASASSSLLELQPAPAQSPKSSPNIRRHAMGLGAKHGACQLVQAACFCRAARWTARCARFRGTAVMLFK